ncbi:MAG: GNAT family N-acetyltransferase [Alphaproteobacteria bacterium]|nr:GNAT family N-acetyltransferase [Alphaproteobacteria bacterium]
MKRYFFLFRATFIIFKGLLISGFSPSHAMGTEFDEIGENIAISNSQGQKTRKISLCQSEGLDADLKLSFGKGETCWFDEKQIWCHHPYLNGKVYSFQYPEFIEITLSYPALRSELLFIASGLHTYNMEKTGEISEQNFIASYNPPNGSSTISFIGEREQQGLYLFWKEEHTKQAPDATVILLIEIQKRAQQKRIHSLYIVSPMLSGPYRNIPLEEGFHLTGYGTVDKTEFYYKTSLQFFNEPQENNPHVTIEYEKEEGIFPPIFGRCFGVFIRNDKGLIQGGVFGSFHKADYLPYPYGRIEVFWVDEAIRCLGLGKKAFSMAENFLKVNGAYKAELGTADYQAPWFYKKMGYIPVVILPEATKTLDGKWNSHYKFEKHL